MFAISPLEILCINMLTSLFRDFGPSREYARQEPWCLYEVDLVDMLVYGPLMGLRPRLPRARHLFAELTWLILVSSWEFKDIRHNMFRLNPDGTSAFQIFKDLIRFLFSTMTIGALSVFPVIYIYIRVFNHSVFGHTGIKWK
ncbi:Uu.00g013220.m01.CDS01 [Anthostomella pinea]|uniref:Uu.00g013220.m01.CDS01 n=1 Tax=Anthostomella pinea TaxID=933095 RepID=A0AAI8YQ76_9PEZI|nr:Uu.00g013220.m01.CDS01 [Anthostomella pinea]